MEGKLIIFSYTTLDVVCKVQSENDLWIRTKMNQKQALRFCAGGHVQHVLILCSTDDAVMHSDNIRIFHQILDGVDYIHTSGLIHRDLKVFLSMHVQFIILCIHAFYNGRLAEGRIQMSNLQESLSICRPDQRGLGLETLRTCKNWNRTKLLPGYRAPDLAWLGDCSLKRKIARADVSDK